jgi:hypothetical protein
VQASVGVARLGAFVLGPPKADTSLSSSAADTTFFDTSDARNAQYQIAVEKRDEMPCRG